MGELKRNKLIEIVIFAVLILFILTLTLTITINFSPIFKFSLKYLDIQGKTGILNSIIYKNYTQLMGYLNNPTIKNLEMDVFSSSASGEFHFYEVKKLFLLNYTLLVISFIFLVLMYFFYSKKRGVGLKQFKIPLLIISLLPLLGVAFVFIDFDFLFLKFHESLFSNNMWVFDPYVDPIINVLSQEFFSFCFIFGLVLFEVLIVTLAVAGFLKKPKKQVDTGLNLNS